MLVLSTFFGAEIRAHVALEGKIAVFISSMLSQKHQRGKCIEAATTRQYRISIGVDGLIMNQKFVLTVISLLIKEDYS